MDATKVLFVGSHDRSILIREAAAEAGLELHHAAAPNLFSEISAGQYPLVVAQTSLPDVSAWALLERARKTPIPILTILLLDGMGTIDEAVRLVRSGAYHVLDEAAEKDELVQVLGDAKEEVRTRAVVAPKGNSDWRSILVGANSVMRDLGRVIELVASRRCTVLITGETGTGKEMAARAIHLAGDRARFPMVALNCSAIPEHLLEAELFGHTRGAFTGAVGPRVGRFEEAQNSTLFLDEIGDMPLDLQAKLLRVLQERELQRLGSSETIKLNVRVIAASNLDLMERVKQGKFREDLYYRLNVVPVQMPPLRHRASDIALLARHFVHKICRLEGIPLKEVFNETLDHLSRYSWPGNVRQLENLVEKAVVMSGDRPALLVADFPLPKDVAHADFNRAAIPLVVPNDGLDFAATVSSFEKSILEQMLHTTNGNRTLAADRLRLRRTTLVSKLKAFESVCAYSGSK